MPKEQFPPQKPARQLPQPYSATPAAPHTYPNPISRRSNTLSNQCV